MQLVASAGPAIRVIPGAQAVGGAIPAAEGIPSLAPRLHRVRIIRPERQLEGDRPSGVDLEVVERGDRAERDHQIAHQRNPHPAGDHLPEGHPVAPVLEPVLQVGVDAHELIGDRVDPPRRRGIRPLLAFGQDPEPGAHVAEAEANHLGARRVDPHLPGDQREPLASRCHLHLEKAQGATSPRGDRQRLAERVAVPRRGGGRERVQRPGGGKLVAEDPDRVIHRSRHEPRSIPHARELHILRAGP